VPDGVSDARPEFGAGEFQARTGVSRETLERFELWRRRLEDANAHTNLVGRSTLTDFWFRHAYDSWQLIKLQPEAARWADLGAGAGFPGLAIAFALMDQGVADARVICVESIAKKAAFIRSVAEATGAPVTVHAARAESLDPIPHVDVVTARAMAPLPKLLGYVHPFVENGAVALLPKGARHAEELTTARKSWTLDAEVIPSATAPEAAILKIRTLTRDR
jgi:16S rRNA (guanine527-N7)-methyltransferase